MKYQHQPSCFRPALATAVLLLLAAVPPALAQREPVLKQIRLPHSYYYRELYLPQATSGPSAAAWSPDGRELVYSMQGSLWRQALGSTTAVQLTDGPGYDYQPDWSPDGRFVAYASYRDDAVELWLLELATGATRPLTRGGAVNVEPRFAPDGTRIAYVSTAYEGRFHVFLLPLRDGTAGEPVRLSEDRDSGLPRYYYARHDHYLSPSWSPDGAELLLVSNRGRIWGTGGLWRMRAEPGAEMRELHFEETTWKARPDWARDGRRVVYASYLGRQWHQLWLMPADGGDVFPLTYGEFDATAPRFAPDGSRIAYVSNAGGNTSLWTITLPGGAREQVVTSERHYKSPVAGLEIRVRGADGATLPARLSITTPDGRSWAPDDAWRHADDHFDRAQRRLEYGYFHTPGLARLTLPAGPVVVEASRGPEYRVVRRELTLPAGGGERLEIVLERLADLAAQGLWSGDLHVHMNYTGSYRNDPGRLAFQAAAEDLHVIESLIVNKEQRVPDVAYFRGAALDPASTADTLVSHGQEYHTSFWGHSALLGLAEHLVMPDYAGYVNTAAASLHPDNTTVFELARAQGALTGYVHPFDTLPDPARDGEPLTHALPVDVALGTLDYYEVVGFSDHLASAAVWYRLLNCGFRLPAGAGTDAMANYASLRGPVGMNRVYVKAGPALDHARFLEGLKAGRSFATNGPLVWLRVAGREPGEELVLPAGAHELEIEASLDSFVPVDRLELVANGRVVAELPLDGDRTHARLRRTLTVERSGWYALRARGERARHPVLDLYPFATTSPVYVSVGGAPRRSREDALFFAAWVDRLVAAARSHVGWNAPAESEAVLARLAAARRVFEQRAGAADAPD